MNTETTAIIKPYVEGKRSKAIRRNWFNQDYFETIDSHEKAQVLGLWYADGNVRMQRCGQRNSFNYSCRIQLAEEDKDYLEEVNHRLGCTTDLTFIKRARPHYQDSYALILYSKKTFDDLIDKGCVPCKSLILTFPTIDQVPLEFVPSFMAGYLEGDGCITTYPVSGYPNSIQSSIRVTSTLEFCRSYGAILERECDVHYNLYRHKSCQTNNYTLGVAGNKQVMRVMEFLYRDTVFAMKRKYDKHELIARTVAKSVENREARKTQSLLGV